MTAEERAEDQDGNPPVPVVAGLVSASVPDDGTSRQEDDDTVGTGSAIALGCVAGTLLLIVIGLILIAVFALAR